MILMGKLSTEYTIDYNESDLESYEQLNEINVLVEEIDEGTDIEEETGVIDKIGSYFTDAYNVLKLTKKSYDTFDTMKDEAIDDANLGQTGAFLRIMIGAIILIMIVIGVLLSAILKKDI